MKEDDTHRAAMLVSAAAKLETAAKRLLETDAGEMVSIKVQGWGLGRTFAEADIPPTYIAKILREYRESVVLEAERMGVEFK